MRFLFIIFHMQNDKGDNMTRLFTEAILADDQKTYFFTGEDARYLAGVLRMQPGGILTLCDGARTEFTCKIASISHGRVSVELQERKINQTEPPYEAVMYQALVKGDKMDWIIQKGVELGVSIIVPVRCIRSISKLEGKDIDKKIARWQRIAEAAARQCGRGNVPVIWDPMNFATALEQATSKSDLVFLPWEGEKSCSLSSVLDAFAKKKRSDTARRPRLSFFIGPEGGFDPTEIDLAVKNYVKSVTLGRRILRTETAGIAVLSMFIYRLEQM
jgi:16S rRNA (uracil1498-N3)-methyltransferase